MKFIFSSCCFFLRQQKILKRILLLNFIFSSFSLCAQYLTSDSTLYQSEQAAIVSTGGNFFSYSDNYSSLDTSFVLQNKNFYFLTNGMFAPKFQNYQAHTISSISAGNLFVGAGTLQNKNQHYFLNIGFGKKFNRYISSGFLLRPMGEKIDDQFYGHVGFHYALRAELMRKQFNKIFALHSLQILFGVSNLGVSWFAPHRKEDSLLLALHAQLIQAKNFSWLLFAQGGWRLGSKFSNGSVGSEFGFYFARLRIGYINDSYIKKNAITLGIGFLHSWQDTQFKFDYAFSADMSKEMYHSLSVSFAWNIVDKEMPNIEITPQPKFISQQNKELSFVSHLKEKSELQNWQLQVFNENGNLAGAWQMDKRGMFALPHIGFYFKDFFTDMNRKFLPKKIFADFWNAPYAHKPSVYNPDAPHQTESLSWADGNYTYTYYAQDKWGNRSPEKNGSFVIDRTSPQWKSIQLPNICSSFCKIEVAVNGNPQDTIVFRLENSLQEIVREEKFFLHEYNGNYSLNTNMLEEGAYRLHVEAFDDFNNRQKETTRFFYIKKDGDIAGGVILSALFNPLQTPLIYNPQNFSRREISRWVFRIEEPPIKNKRTKIIYERAGMGNPPASLFWNGKIFNRQYAKDGQYKLIFKAYSFFEKDSSLQSFNFVIDTTPPKIKFYLPYKKALPDQDYFKDNFLWHVRVQESSPIDSYDFDIFEYNANQKPLLVKSWHGKDMPPKTFLWNARLPSGEISQSFSRFGSRLTIRDTAGNESTAWQTNLKLGISGEYKNENKFIFSIPLPKTQEKKNIKFLSKTLKKYLTESYYYLLRYPDYKIRVEAHLMSPDDDAENLPASEKLARLVTSFLIKKGISVDKISAMGMGETYPIYNNRHQGNYGNYKNQRITLILYKN